MTFQEKCRVMGCANLAEHTYLLKLHAPDIATAIKPGQMVFVRCSQREVPLLRRPFAVFDTDLSEQSMDILFEVKGRGTALLSRTRPNDVLDVLGPSGNGFPILNTGEQTMIAVAGGMGLAPIHLLCRHLLALARPVHLFYGTQTAAKNVKLQLQQNVNLRVSTDDGTLGEKGMVTDFLEKQADCLGPKGIVFACGPEPMMKAVWSIAQARNWQCYVSLERHMACGVGACNGCITDTWDESGKIKHQRVCKEGPVFNAKELVWN